MTKLPLRGDVTKRDYTHIFLFYSDTELIMLGGQTSDGSILLVTLPNIELFEQGKGWTNIGALNPPRYYFFTMKMNEKLINVFI